MDDPQDAAFVTGLCYLLAPVGWQPVITTVLILLFTSRTTVQPFLAVFPRHVELALEEAIENSILEYTAWLLSCIVIMYAVDSYWEKLAMIAPILIFSVCLISHWASCCWHRSHSKTNMPVRDVFVTVGDRHPDLLSLDHPLSKLVVNTKAELAKAHSLLRNLAAPSVNIRGPLDTDWTVQKFSRLIGNRRSQIVRFMSPWRFNPNSPVFPPPLGPRYAMLRNEADIPEIPWLAPVPSAIWIDGRLANMWEDERRTEPPGYNDQCDLFLKATICHEMLNSILLDVEKIGHLPDDD
ncbi:uncharacterized protein F5891DRAFT_643582 [Suillus fuscotomentosus]|uniref:Uncharacterized protein n=1 Tax=Suillus fuscotomentosus TaxID=1912939 RepID=A0AAD4HGY8_9AGAM|nr:uncharacterized protein F5891DRAFT_643582 [Suillus fuscotomentosus]KAG1895856.1 hypothetical protein F5891DRAFT_643582 [Suillus fuscotomentosus]